MKKTIILFWLAVACMSANAQAKFEIREFSGTVRSFQPGYFFAFEFINIDVNGEQERFRFMPVYGELFMQNFKVGDPIKLKVKLNTAVWEQAKKAKDKQKMGELLWYFSRQTIQEVFIAGKWVQTPEERLVEMTKKQPELLQPPTRQVFLEKPIRGFYELNGFRAAAIFDDNMVAECNGIGRFYDPLKFKNVGDPLSFVGTKLEKREGYVFPIPVSEIYNLSLLTRKTGTLKSYMYKQNYACIGVKFNTPSGDFQVSIPSDKAASLQQFLKPDRELVFYHGLGEFDAKSNLAPELHTVIMGKDTLVVESYGFYGGPDGRHDFKAVQFTGKIREVNRQGNGRVLSLLVDNTYFIEVDPRFDKQIGSKLHKGIEIAVTGEERVKREGEVYSKNYRIITPSQITIEGKVYLLNQP